MLHAREDYQRIQDPCIDAEKLSQRGIFSVDAPGQIWGPDGLFLSTFQESDAVVICEILNRANLLKDGASPIAEDEPVMLFRAKDILAEQVLDYYAEITVGDISTAAADHANKFRAWPNRKMPDL